MYKYFDEVDRLEIEQELKKEKPNLEYLKVLGYFNEQVQDLIEKQAIERDSNHFMENILQMIDNWNINEELWIWNSENKYNKKVMNLISKSDKELKDLWISIENIIKFRIKIDVKSLFQDIYSTLIEWRKNEIIEYLLQKKDINYLSLWFNLNNKNILSYLKNLNDGNYEKISIPLNDREKLRKINKMKHIIFKEYKWWKLWKLSIPLNV